MSAWEAGTWPGDWKRMADMRQARIADLERQLAEARDKLQAVREWHNALKSMGADVRSLDAILGEKGA